MHHLLSDEKKRVHVKNAKQIVKLNLKNKMTIDNFVTLAMRDGYTILSQNFGLTNQSGHQSS